MQDIGKIDVAWRGQVVTGHGLGREVSEPHVRGLTPDVSGKEERVKADTAVRGGDSVGVRLSPRRYHAVDRPRVELRPVAEHDHRGVHVVPERVETAAKRRAGPALPPGAVNDSGIRFHSVGPEYDHEVVDRTCAYAVEHSRQQHALLRRAEPCRGAGREDDRGDHSPGSIYNREARARSR